MSDFTAVISNGLATLRSSADAAGRSIGTMTRGMTTMGNTGEKEFRKIGEAISKMGGPLGSIGGKLFGSAGMEGGLGRLAIVATLVGVAMSAMSNRFEAAQRRADALIKSVDSARGALGKFEDERDKFRAGSEGTGRAVAAAESVWGSTAGADIKQYSEQYKLKPEDIAASMVATRRFDPSARKDLLEAALTASQTGEGSPVEFLSQITDRATAQRVMTTKAGGAYSDSLSPRQRRAAAMLAMSRGANGFAGMTDAGGAILRSGTAGAASDAVGGVNVAGTPLFSAQLGQFTSGATSRALATEAATKLEAVANVFDRALRQWTEEKNKAVIEAIRRESEVNGNLFAALWEGILIVKDFAMGGDASMSSQRRLAEDARDTPPPEVFGTSGN